MRAAAGIARLSIGATRGDGFDMVRSTKQGDVAATVSLAIERPDKTPTLRLRTEADPGFSGLILRFTREQTPRGQGRKYRELVVGAAEIDDAWAIEGSATDKDRVLAARDALSKLRPYDAEVSFDRNVASAAVRSSEGRRSLSLENVAEALDALICVWRAFGEADGVTTIATGDDRTHAAALESLRDEVRAAVALFAGDVHRVGDAWASRVLLSLAGDVELHAEVTVTPAKGFVLVELDGAVSRDATPARVTKKRVLVGNDDIVIDADEPLRSSGAVRALLNARRVDAIVAPVFLQYLAANVAACIEGALELWRAAHAGDAIKARAK